MLRIPLLGFPGAGLPFPHEACFSIPELPAGIAFAGSGYISFEPAHITAGRGRKVTTLSHEGYGAIATLTHCFATVTQAPWRGAGHAPSFVVFNDKKTQDMRTTLLYLTIVTCCSHAAFGQYDETVYTITAPSGLSLREGPGTEYPRLTAIPFDTQISLTPSHRYDELRDTINEHAGYWVPVRYEQQEGYVFSAYLKPGHLFTPGTATVNKNYRIAIPGMRFSALNYDPSLHWYALVAKTTDESGDFLLEKASPTVNFEPMTYEERYNWGETDGLVSIDVDRGEDLVALLIGTPAPIEQPAALPQKTYYELGLPYPAWGRPVYPFQQLNLFQHAGDRYALSGHARPNSESTDDHGALDYVIGLSRNRYAGAFYAAPDEELSPELTDSPTEQCAKSANTNFRHHPRVFWQGDLNGDTLPDLIFYQPDVSECCGGSEAYYLLVSERDEAGTWRWKRVAFDVLESFGGC